MTNGTTAQDVGRSVRRFIVFTLLFILVVLAGIGISGLLGRLVDVPDAMYDGDTEGLALNLAFALIAGPLAILLWWLSWRSLDSAAERDSILWGLYVAAMTTVTLIVSVIALVLAISSLIDKDLDGSALANAIVWAVLWVWHRWMSRHPVKSPTRFAGGARVLGSVFALIVGSIGLSLTLSVVFHEALSGDAIVSSAGEPWWVSAAQAFSTAAVGALVWWLHWFRDGGRRLRTGFAVFALVLVAGFGSVALALSQLALSIQSILVAIFVRAESFDSTVDNASGSVAAALVGALVWAIYRREVRAAPFAAKLGTRLLTSGVALAVLATGVGIVVDSILGVLTTPFLAEDAQRLLIGGLTALVVGGVAWWLAWKPLASVSDELTHNTTRRVYLIVIFGVSALVAIVTVVTIAFQLFTFGLGGATAEKLIESIRGSLGLLVATGLVFAYHFSLWRRDRARAEVAPAARRISRVVLVARDAALAGVVREITGANVTVFESLDDSADTLDRSQLEAALEGVEHARVLVLVTGSRVEVVPLTP